MFSLSLSLLAGKFKKSFRVILLILFIPGVIALTGCEADGGDSAGGSGGSDRIVLANSLTTAATDDIEPDSDSLSDVVMTGGDGATTLSFKETFNTLFYNNSKFQSGKKYVFNGVLDSTGKVVDRVFIRGNVTAIDLEVNNAQLTVGTLYGSSKITIDVPCYDEIPYNGTIIKADPKPPFDKVPVLQTGTLNSETTITAPKLSKILASGVFSTIQ